MTQNDIGVLAFLVGLPAAAFVMTVLEWLFVRRRPESVFRRGAKLLSVAEAARRAARCPAGRFPPPPGFTGLAFGGLRLLLEYAWTGIIILGETGSGKSTLVLQYIDSVLDLITRLSRTGRGTEVRAVLFDAKRDLTGHILGRLPPGVPVYIVLPFDARSARWRVAEDICTPAEAEQLAAVLIPEGKAGDNQPFWRLASIDTVTVVVVGLIRAAPGRWTLKDVKHICRSRRRLKWFLRQWPDTWDVAAQYLNNRSAREVVATIGVYLGRYGAVLGCWDRAEMSFSIREFLDSGGVLVLGLDDSVAEALKPLYALMARRLSDLILARNDPTRPTFIVKDEAALFGKIDLLPLALKGRSAGASILLTTQDVQSLEVVHGEKEARTLIGSLLTRGLLRVTSEASCRFSSDAIGEEEVYQYTTNVAEGGPGRTVTRSEAVVRRPVVLPDQIKSLPRPDWAAGEVSGYFVLPDVGAYRADVRFRDDAPPPPPGPPVPDYLPRPGADQTPVPFGRHDLARLGLPDNPLTRKVFGVADGFKPGPKPAP
ncbi:MAG: type IV secretion system DNA-binding domain-containing protein [Gemmataceae bacterium]|nr:type IV secretion system DNA-binding domain-containing protein [Gemmataceae bacterium]